MFSFLAVTPTPWLGMCLCKESGFESQGYSSRVCAGAISVILFSASSAFKKSIKFKEMELKIIKWS